jgi:hypothetical protein
MDLSSVIAGMMRAARLEVPFYEEVEKDVSRTRDAWTVVIIVAIASAINGFIAGLIGRSILPAILGLILQPILTIAAYFVLSYLIFFVGTRLFHGTADYGEVQRCIGFAYAPLVLGVLAWIPCVGWIISLVAWIWVIATCFIATRSALDIDNTNAALTVIIAGVLAAVVWLIWTIIMAIIGGIGAAATGAITG